MGVLRNFVGKQLWARGYSGLIVGGRSGCARVHPEARRTGEVAGADDAAVAETGRLQVAHDAARERRATKLGLGGSHMQSRGRCLGIVGLRQSRRGETTMKLAYIIGAFPLKSETFIAREVLGLRELGAEVDVFAIHGPSSEELAQLPRAVQDLGGSVTYIGHAAEAFGLIRAVRCQRALKFNARLSREATLKANEPMRMARAGAIARLLERGHFDRIHAHWPYGSQLAALAHLMTGVPLSISVHAHEVAHDNGHFPALFDLVDYAAFCNTAAMDYLARRLPPEAERRCRLVYHGVDLAEFPMMPLPDRLPPLRIVSAGRLAATKGMDRLVRGLAAVRSAGLAAELTVVGDGSQRGALEALATRLGVAEHLHITGWVTREAVREHLGNAHVFALLADTTYHDGLPNVVLEAMATGRPVVLSPLPAAAEAIADTATGFVLRDHFDTGELSRVLCDLARNPERLREMGRRARAHVERAFDSRVHIKRLLELHMRGS